MRMTCRWCGRNLDPGSPAEHCSAECGLREEQATLTGDELDLVEFLAGQRNPENLIAAELGITPQSWGKVRKHDPRAREALSRGRAREQKALVDALFAEAVEGGNVQAAQFLLRARHGYDDKSSRPEVVNVAVMPVLPRALSPEQYAELQRVLSLPEPKNVTPRLAEVSE